MRFSHRSWKFAVAAAAAMCSAIPSYASGQWTLKVLHDGCSRNGCKDGYAPQGPVLRHSADTYYGTMQGAGLASVVFEIKFDAARNKWIYQVIHRFCSCHDDGVGPIGNLIEDVNGNLYGVTTAYGAGGAGNVYELSPNTDHSKWSFQALHSFPAQSDDGFYPAGGLTYPGANSGALYDGTSTLYGLTNAGGARQDGVAYSLTPNGGVWNESILHDFCSQTGCPDGRAPIGTPVLDAAGDVYGVTEFGGNSNDGGVVFEITGGSGAWTQTVLHDFCIDKTCSDGNHPSNGLLIDALGNVYGTAFSGGSGRKSAGVVFKVAPAGEDSTYIVLYSFCQRRMCRDGKYPRSNLAFDASGNIYGATYEGGSHDQGSVFRLGGSDLATLYSFCSASGCDDGGDPYGVTWDPSGDLFGTAYAGGAEGAGSVYKLSPP
jgi:uncharacterized repeat protein (TIGR03803 family)